MDEYILVSKGSMVEIFNNCSPFLLDNLTRPTVEILNKVYGASFKEIFKDELIIKKVVSYPEPVFSYMLEHGMLSEECLKNLMDHPKFNNIKSVYLTYLADCSDDLRKLPLVDNILKKGYVKDVIEKKWFNDTISYYLLSRCNTNPLWVALDYGVDYTPKSKSVTDCLFRWIDNNGDHILNAFLKKPNSQQALENLLKNPNFNWNLFWQLDSSGRSWLDCLNPLSQLEYFLTIYTNPKFKLKYLYNTINSFIFDEWLTNYTEPNFKSAISIVSSKRFSSNQLNKLCSSSFLVDLLNVDKKFGYANFKEFTNVLLEKKLVDGRLFNVDLIKDLFFKAKDSNGLQKTIERVFQSGIKLNDDSFREYLTRFITTSYNVDEHFSCSSEDEYLSDEEENSSGSFDTDQIKFKLELAYLILKNMEFDTRKKEIPECSICMENFVDCVLSPCGHTACLLCSIQLKKCHICRKHVDQRVRFYL